MFYKTGFGEDILLTSVVIIEPSTGSGDRECYKVHFSGGQHVTIKESEKTRLSFVNDWKAAFA